MPTWFWPINAETFAEQSNFSHEKILLHFTDRKISVKVCLGICVCCNNILYICCMLCIYQLHDTVKSTLIKTNYINTYISIQGIFKLYKTEKQFYDYRDMVVPYVMGIINMYRYTCVSVIQYININDIQIMYGYLMGNIL